tara:strand:- start:1774 stop:2625 length:852 start_codon:yes stop_codon:yes gene_type:complete
MKSKLEIRKKIASSWFRFLQSQICEEFEKIEKRKSGIGKSSVFKKKSWKKSTDPKDGGGMYAVIKNGAVFDSVGVNFSEVSGKFHKKFRAQILGAKKNPNYWASGISVVAHMKNPKIPAMHFNTRFIVTSKSWFGGGMDATPSIKDDEEKKFFHKKIKYTCDKYNKKYYSRYRKWCDKYFYLPHRKETRGIGGIFFDYKKDNWEKDFSFVRNVGLCFLDCAKSIVEKKMKTKWSKKQKNEQLYKRGRYIEFNLLYDRGTRFGLNTGGNVEAILMSLPPMAKWK